MSHSRKFSPARVASAPTFIPLEAIHVAAPCHADWDAMSGDERARFCGSCQKNVYNLSEMTPSEAESLILEKEGKLCVRYYQRADGTILTQDCPIGMLQVDRRLRGRIATATYFSALFTLCFALLSGSLAMASPDATTGEVVPNKQNPQPMIMGKMVAPSVTPAPNPTMGIIAPRPTVTPAPKPTATPKPQTKTVKTSHTKKSNSSTVKKATSAKPKR